MLVQGLYATGWTATIHTGNSQSATAGYGGVWAAGGVLILCRAQRSRACRSGCSYPASQSCTFVNCSSIADSVNFYQDVCWGLELVYEQRGFVAFFPLTTGAFLCVCLRRNREHDSASDAKGAIVSLVSQSNAEVDAWHQTLAAKADALDRDARIEKSPGAGISSDGKVVPIYNMFLRDPAGYLVEYEVFRDAAWPAVLATGRLMPFVSFCE